VRHYRPTTIALVGTDALAEDILARLLEREGYPVRHLEAYPTGLMDELLDDVDVLLLAPGLDAEARDALLGIITSTSKTAVIQVLSLSSALKVALLDELSAGVSWRSLVGELVGQIGDALTRAATSAGAFVVEGYGGELPSAAQAADASSFSSELRSFAHDLFLLDGSESVRARDGCHVYGASYPPGACSPTLKRGGRFYQEYRKVDAILQGQELVRDGHRETSQHLLSEVCRLCGIQVHVRPQEVFQLRVVAVEQPPRDFGLSAEGDAEVLGAFLYGRRRVGDLQLENLPVGVTLVETADQKDHGVRPRGRVRSGPLVLKEVAQSGGEFLYRQTLLRNQLRLELREVAVGRSGLPVAQCSQSVGDRPDEVLAPDFE
jgi:hypothetical protein